MAENYLFIRHIQVVNIDFNITFVVAMNIVAGIKAVHYKQVASIKVGHILANHISRTATAVVELRGCQSFTSLINE